MNQAQQDDLMQTMNQVNDLIDARVSEVLDRANQQVATNLKAAFAALTGNSTQAEK